MNSHTEIFFIEGRAGVLECALDYPVQKQKLHGIALVAHPHPLFSGTMYNKVCTTLVKSFVTLGYVTARMNFRGVGASAGVHDEGRGETDDMAQLLGTMRARYLEPGLSLVLGGFSFGTFVQAQLQQRLICLGQMPAQQLVLVGTAVGKWSIPIVPPNTMVIHGEMDETIPLSAVLDWARPQMLPVIVVPGADHFFNRRLVDIKQIIVGHKGLT